MESQTQNTNQLQNQNLSSCLFNTATSLFFTIYLIFIFNHHQIKNGLLLDGKNNQISTQRASKSVQVLDQFKGDLNEFYYKKRIIKLGNLEGRADYVNDKCDDFLTVKNSSSEFLEMTLNLNNFNQHFVYEHVYDYDSNFYGCVPLRASSGLWNRFF